MVIAVLLLPAGLAIGQTTSSSTSISASSTDPTIPSVIITSDGLAKVTGMKVWQTAGRSLFTRTTWGDSFIRWTVKTTADTVITKHYGDPLSVYDISENDWLSVDGIIEGGNSLAITATKITDWLNYQAQSSFTGTISNLGNNNLSFNLATKQYGIIQVSLATSSVIYRNRREITPQYIRTGDTALLITGTYDYNAKTLSADKVTIYIDPNIFLPKNYQGTLVKIDGTTLPTTMTLNIGGQNYAVDLAADATVLNKARATVTLDRFLAGDSVRIYGFIRPDDDDLSTINASVLRNISF